MQLEDIRVSDLKLIKELAGVHSIRELARRISVDPQNLTKRIKQLEETLGAKIVNRSSKGISLTKQGDYLSKKFSDTVYSLENAFLFIQKSEHTKKRIRFCGRGYMISHFLYSCKAELLKEKNYVFDLMDLSPQKTEQAARSGLLDVILSFEDTLLGPNWMRKEVGTVRWGFFARKNHPLANKNNIRSLKNYDLLGFSYIENSRIAQVANANQIKLDASRSHGCENSRYSMQILKQTDSIACLPEIATQEEVDKGNLARLSVVLETQERPLILSINKDTISAAYAKKIRRVFTNNKPR